jgi:predicted nucleic-acid-binding Zn-ribbon protein
MEGQTLSGEAEGDLGSGTIKNQAAPLASPFVYFQVQESLDPYRKRRRNAFTSTKVFRVLPSTPSRHRVGFGVEMANWVLSCRKCKTNFEHSKIAVAGLANYFIPLKPEFPPDGIERECPNCGYKAFYQKTDIKYQA